MSSTQKTLIKWLSDNACIPRGCGRFDRFVARHLTNGNQPGDISDTWDVPETVNDTWFEDTASEVLGKLTIEAAGLGGRQKWALYAYFTESADKPISRHVIRIHNDEEGEQSSLDTEGPDKNGLVSQSMRHTEVTAKIYTQAQAGLLTAYQQMVNRLSGTVDKMLEERFEREGAIMELMTAKREDEIASRQADMKQRAIEKSLESVGALLPVIINKVAGTKVMPEQGNGVLMMGKSLFSSFTAEQMRTFAATLSQEQLITFMSLGEALSDGGKSAPNGQETQ